MCGYERIRARDGKGRYIADDPRTKYTNEAYTIRKKTVANKK